MHKLLLILLLTLLPTAAFSTTNYDPGVNGNIGGFQGTNCAAYTPIFGADFGAATAISFQYCRIGDSAEIYGSFTTGTLSNVTVGGISLPSGLSIDTAKIKNNTTANPGPIVGIWTQDAHASYSGNIIAAVSTSATVVYLANQFTNSAPLTTGTFFGIGFSSTIISVKFRVPISGWSAGGAGGGVQYLWSGYHDDDCTFSRTNTAFGDPAADSTCTFTQLQNQNFGTVTSYVSGSDKLPGLVFTPTFSGMIYICAGAKVYKSSSAGDTFIELSDTGSQVLSYGWHANGSVNTGISVQTCGIYSATSGVAATIRLRSKASAGSVVIGDNGGSTTAIDWTMYKIN